MAESCINIMVLEELAAAAVDAAAAEFGREDCNLILDGDDLEDALLITYDVDRSGRLSSAVNRESVDRKQQPVDPTGIDLKNPQNQASTSLPNRCRRYESTSSNQTSSRTNYNSKRCRSMEPLIRHTSITNVQYLQKAAAAAKHIQACNGNGRISAPALFTSCLLSFIPFSSSAFNDQIEQDIDLDEFDDEEETEKGNDVKESAAAPSPPRASVKIAADRAAPAAISVDDAVKPHRRSSRKCCSAFVPNSCIVNSSRNSSMSLSDFHHHRISTSENVTETTTTDGSGNDFHRSLLPERISSRNSINSIRLMSHAEIEQTSVETEYNYRRKSSLVNAAVVDECDISPSRWAEAAAADEAAAMARSSSRASTAECCSCVSHVFPLRRMMKKRVTAGSSGKVKIGSEVLQSGHSQVLQEQSISGRTNVQNRVWPYGSENSGYGEYASARRSNVSSTSSKQSSNDRYRTAAALNGLYRAQITEVISLREMYGRRSSGATIGSPMAQEVVQAVSNLQESPVASTFVFNDYQEMMMVRRSSCSNSSSCRSSSVSSTDVLSRRESCSSNDILAVGHRRRVRYPVRRVRLPEEIYVSRICSLRSAGTGVSSGTSLSYRTATDGSSNRLDELHMDQSPLHFPHLLPTSSLNFSR